VLTPRGGYPPGSLSEQKDDDALTVLFGR